MLRLKAAAEAAKIELSTKEFTVLDANLHSLSRVPVNFETRISRKEIGRAAEPIILKAIAIARRVLAEKNVSASAVEKLVFVGGPTIAPYFRDIVAAHLGIPFDTSVDPLTVVARGAAIFAGGQRITSASASKSATPMGQFSLELIYKPVGADLEPLVGGKISAPYGSVKDYTIEVVHQGTRWRGGRVPLGERGTFQLTARADRNVKNTFTIELRDGAGALCPVSPNQFDYTVGVGVEEQPIINNLGVAMADNRMTVHFVKGQGLPAKCTKTYRTSTELRRGASGSVVKIPIVEGNHDLADRNVLIGSLDIMPDKVSRDLPGGSEIEVTLQMDASRILTVVAYVPMLDEEFPTQIHLGGKLRQPDPALLRTELLRELIRLQELQQSLDEVSAPTVLTRLRTLASSTAVRSLEKNLARDDADFDTLLQSERALIDFKIQIDSLAALASWPLLVKEAEGWLADLDAVARRHGTFEEKRRSGVLREQVQTIITEKNGDRLRKKIDEMSDVHSSMLYRQASFWTAHFETLTESRSQMSHPAKADELIARGNAYIETGQLEELKNVVYLLQDLLPRQVVERARRGYGSTLLV
jgi:molecular chaperone DnaK